MHDLAHHLADWGQNHWREADRPHHDAETQNILDPANTEPFGAPSRHDCGRGTVDGSCHCDHSGHADK